MEEKMYDCPCCGGLGGIIIDAGLLSQSSEDCDFCSGTGKVTLFDLLIFKRPIE